MEEGEEARVVLYTDADPTGVRVGSIVASGVACRMSRAMTCVGDRPIFERDIVLRAARRGLHDG